MIAACGFAYWSLYIALRWSIYSVVGTMPKTHGLRLVFVSIFDGDILPLDVREVVGRASAGLAVPYRSSRYSGRPRIMCNFHLSEAARMVR